MERSFGGIYKAMQATHGHGIMHYLLCFLIDEFQK
jgi:hypothetical protein